MSLIDQAWDATLAEMRAAEARAGAEWEQVWANMVRTARLSPCGKYRYNLGRRWGWPTSRHVLWVMLYPSTADADVDDPTIRKCVRFSYREGFGRLTVVNLFAYRSTDPAAMLALPADVARGPENNEELAEQALNAEQIICAWGVPGGKMIPEALWPHRFKCYHLGLTASGAPKHPLYLANDTPLHRLAVV